MTQLNEIIELNYTNRKDRMKKTNISEVYGIIYRIYCITEKKSYVGQTFSHINCLQYLQRHGLISRCKIHYRAKDYEENKNKPLYQALNKYTADQFEVYEETRLYREDIAKINQIEAEYIEKYNCLNPNGYNIEEVGKKYSKLLTMLSEHYGFEIQRPNYIDKTRKDRCKDVCFGIRFGLKRASYSNDLILANLKNIVIDSIRLVQIRKELRIIVKEKGVKDNIRVYFKGSKEECETFARQLTNKIEISESFRGQDCYKYQSKLDKVLSLEDITRVAGKIYDNAVSKSETYLIIFYGKKNNKIQSLARISFGGKTVSIEQSKNDAIEFIENFKKQTKSEPIYSLQ